MKYLFATAKGFPLTVFSSRTEEEAKRRYDFLVGEGKKKRPNSEYLLYSLHEVNTEARKKPLKSI